MSARSYVSAQRKKKTRNASRTKRRAARLEFKATCPPGLSKEQRAAWEEAAKSGFGETWTPKGPGDTLIGRVVSVSSFKSKFGPMRKACIDTGKGVMDLVFGTVLEREWEEKNPKIGEQVLVIYKGESGGKRGRPARVFGLSIVGKRSGAKSK